MDGNQLLKQACLHDGVAGDQHQFQSNYFINEDTVNKFKHDIKPHARQQVQYCSDILFIYAMTDLPIIRLQKTPRRTSGHQIILKLVPPMAMRLTQLVQIAGKQQCQTP